MYNMHNVPGRRMNPPEPREPEVDCWYCNEGIFADWDNEVFMIGEYICCGKEKCVEAIAMEMEIEDEYVPMNDDYCLARYVVDNYGHYENLENIKEDKNE